MTMFDRDGRRPEEVLKQHGGEAREMFQRNYFGQGAPNIKPIDMRHVDMPGYTVEFVVKGEDLIMHFFRSDNDGWMNEFRSQIWKAMMEGFKLHDHQERLIIEWVPEMYSWCVTIKKLAIVAPPDDDIVLSALQRI